MAPEQLLSSGTASRCALCSTTHASSPCSDPSAFSRSCRPVMTAELCQLEHHCETGKLVLHCYALETR